MSITFGICACCYRILLECSQFYEFVECDQCYDYFCSDCLNWVPEQEDEAEDEAEEQEDGRQRICNFCYGKAISFEEEIRIKSFVEGLRLAGVTHLTEGMCTNLVAKNFGLDLSFIQTMDLEAAEMLWEAKGSLKLGTKDPILLAILKNRLQQPASEDNPVMYPDYWPDQLR